MVKWYRENKFHALRSSMSNGKKFVIYFWEVRNLSVGTIKKSGGGYSQS